jgi:hypothetical protein
MAMMAENGIGILVSANFDRAIRYYEWSADLFPEASTRAGWCLQTDLGIPIYFIVVVEFLKNPVD